MPDPTAPWPDAQIDRLHGPGAAAAIDAAYADGSIFNDERPVARELADFDPSTGHLHDCPAGRNSHRVTRVCRDDCAGHLYAIAQDAEHAAAQGLTDRERAAIRHLGDLWGDLCAIVGDGDSRGADLVEMCSHVHALQRAVMAQAAARLYPAEFRLLGSAIPEPVE